MSFPFIDLKAQYLAYKDEIDSAIKKVCENTAFIMGEELRSLEKELSDYTGAEHSIGCSSGTSALELALRALEIKEGDEVITVPFTFYATVETIMLVGATPVFVDVNRDDFNINVDLIEEKISEKTKAIMPVSLYGQCADMDRINDIAKKHNLTVIEDAAQSFGAEYKGKKSCALSTLATTSFFPAKPLGCFGDGGAVFTSSDELNDQIRLIANHGQNARYMHKVVGINGRLDNLQAAILRVKLRHFEDEMKTRAMVASRYNESLKNIVETPEIQEERVSAYAQYTIKVQDRDRFVDELKSDGIPTAIHYPVPLYRQEALAHLGIDPDEFPVTEALSNTVVSLPFSPFLKLEDQQKVIESIQRIYR
ncbi:MAG: DegT/DnrJ/EryC1/StrS family aminotransferase [Campylobacterales bacterium]